MWAAITLPATTVVVAPGAMVMVAVEAKAEDSGVGRARAGAQKGEGQGRCDQDFHGQLRERPRRWRFTPPAASEKEVGKPTQA